MGGMRHVTGFPDRPPVRMNISIGDALASLHGVIGALMALHHRDANGGKGQVVDVALYEAVFNMMESLVPEYDLFGEIRQRIGTGLTNIVPSNTYTTRDGQSVVIAGNGDSIYKRLMHAIGRDDLGQDPALATNRGRVPRTADIDGAIGDWAAAHDLLDVLAALKAADVPHGKIYSAADIVNDPQYLARDMIRQMTLADGTKLKLPGIVPKLSETPGTIEWVGPKLGEHTSEVLTDAGYSAADIERLARCGRDLNRGITPWLSAFSSTMSWPAMASRSSRISFPPSARSNSSTCSRRRASPRSKRPRSSRPRPCRICAMRPK